jgi:hypothetical protein
VLFWQNDYFIIDNKRIMVNRPRDVEKWSQTLQVSVSPETKNKIRILAIKANKSLSNVARELLLQGLEQELSQDD